MARTLGKATIERDWAVKKLVSLDLLSKKTLLEESKLKETTLSLSKQYQLLEVNRTTLYYKPRPVSEKNLQILNTMDEIYTDNPDYGYRMIHQQLLEYGFTVGEKRVLRYMNLLGIEAIRPKKRKLTSIKDKEHKIYKYLLSRYHNSKKQVIVNNPNEIWSGDITYLKVPGGFIYLSAIIDWHTKAILAHKISNSMDETLATDTLKKALGKYPKPKIFNSDQGSQYISYEHIKLLQDNNIEISMNGKGRSIDNIAIERFFRTFKHNYIYINEFNTIQDLKEGAKLYIHKYNFKRFHSAINYQKPMNVYLEGLKKAA